MSGRAYARTAQGFLGGGADLESVVPHTFRVTLPKRTNSARELGIRQCVHTPARRVVFAAKYQQSCAALSLS